MLLDSLNPSQHRAATHIEGPLLVLAGPGSGKTRVVTHRIAHLISAGVPAEQIVALSFTNKAADEMRRRVTDLVGPRPVELGTFHRFAARLLRRHSRLAGLTSDYSILDPDDAHAILKRAAKKSGLTLTHTPIDRVAGIISRAKNDLVTPETFEPRWGRPADEVAARLWPIYQQLLLDANSVDFDDLLVHVARLLLENDDLRRILDARHRWILVDEYQDTNAAQYCIVRGLSIDHPNLAVTGDPDQAIYGWRGASIRNILEFERDYPTATVVALENNYRSTSNILGTADRLIARNSRRKPKRLLTDAPPGPPVRIVLDASSQDESERIADEIAAGIEGSRRRPRDYAILFRTNALSRSFEVSLRARRIPYQLVRGVDFFKRREIRDVVAWLRLLRNPRDDEAMLRVVNVPARGIGKQSLDRLMAWAADRHASLLEAASAAADIPGLSKRSAGSLIQFARLHAELSAQAARATGGAAALIESVLDKTGYRRMLADSDDQEGDEDRLANVEELVTAARQSDESFTPAEGDDPLGAFLETTALVSDTDVWDAQDDRVSLMTLHAAKGLEFAVVYLVAMEDGIVPHERSLDHPDQLEEERRLVFVGITRARDELHASAARLRDYRGTRRISAPSLFLTEMTGSETVVTGPEAPGLEATALAVPFHGDEYCQLAANDVDDQASRRTASDGPIHRTDGLVLELDGDEASDGRRPDPVARRASRRGSLDLAIGTWFPEQPRLGRSLTAGQRVRHPEYGEGLLSAVSGVGNRAVGTVIFDGVAGTRKFVLGRGAIEPVDKSASD